MTIFRDEQENVGHIYSEITEECQQTWLHDIIWWHNVVEWRFPRDFPRTGEILGCHRGLD